MAGERVMWLIWAPGDAAICFKSEVSGLNAWSRLYTVLEMTMLEAKAAGWRCSQITVKETDGDDYPDTEDYKDGHTAGLAEGRRQGLEEAARAAGQAMIPEDCCAASRDAVLALIKGADGEVVLRIQRRRTKGWRLPPNTICVGRGTRWGNPFRVGPAFEGAGVRIPEMTAESAVRCYAEYLDRTLANHQSSRQAVRTLAGANLACWCHLCPRHQAGKPLAEPCPDCAPCHADILGQRAQTLACEAVNA